MMEIHADDDAAHEPSEYEVEKKLEEIEDKLSYFELFKLYE
jgi:hypothetical protein